MIKDTLKNVGIAILFIIGLWMLDALVGKAFFFDDYSYTELAFTRIKPLIFYYRFFLSLSILFFSVGYSLVFSKYVKTNNLLLENQKLYKLLAENVTDVIWTMDLKGNFIYVSPSVEKLRGYTPEEVLNQSFDETLTSESLKIVQALMERLTDFIDKNPEKTPSIVSEIEQSCKNGSSVWTEVAVSIIFDEADKPKFLLGVSRNISDRRKNEKELIRSESNYRLLADSSHDMIIVFDMEGYINYVNTSALNILNVKPEDILGIKISNLISDDYHELMKEISKKILKGERINDFHTLEFYVKKNKAIPVEINTSVVMLNKQPVSVMLSGRDISLRLKAEKKIIKTEFELRKINAHLEDLVEKRTKELIIANKEMESFSYSVSHDLRAPLRHIELFTERLMKELKDGEKNENLKIIKVSVLKMRVLIDSLLGLARLGRAEIKTTKFSMDQLVVETIEDIDIEKKENINWKISTLSDARADRNLARQVLMNLILNAIKFSSKQENPQIEISETEINTKSYYYIKDNGVGFNPKYENKLFKVFQRLHSDSEFKGTGIGLANSKAIIDKHKGEIFARSVLGEGAVFYFRFGDK